MRLIDADALKNALIECTPYAIDPVYRNTNSMVDMFTLMEMLDEQPTIDPYKHGHWTHTGKTNIFGGHQHKCSVCGYSLMVSPLCDNENYCCNCGAKMESEGGT